MIQNHPKLLQGHAKSVMHPARCPLGLETLPPRTRSTFERSNCLTLVVLEVGESSVFHHPYIYIYIFIYLVS